jgi:hypothetical protein
MLEDVAVWSKVDVALVLAFEDDMATWNLLWCIGVVALKVYVGVPLILKKAGEWGEDQSRSIFMDGGRGSNGGV